jgi:hypothetical protein
MFDKNNINENTTWKEIITHVQTCKQLVNWAEGDGIWLNNKKIVIEEMSVRDLRKIVSNDCIDLKFKKNEIGFCPHCSWNCCHLNPSHKSHHPTNYWDNLTKKEKQLLLLLFQEYHP